MAFLSNVLSGLGLTGPALTGTLTPSSPWADRSALETITWGGLLGIDTETLPPTRTQAMALAPVSRARQVLAGTIARLPLTAYRSDAPITTPIIDQPEAGRTRSQTITWTVDALLFYGRAWWIIADRDTTGHPTHAAFIPEWWATTDENGDLTHVKDHPINPRDVIRIDGPHEGLLNHSGDLIRQGTALGRAVMLAANNPAPAVELHQTDGPALTSQEIENLLTAWESGRKRHGVAYTSANIETKAHQGAESQLLISGRDALALDLARACGVPAWAIDVGVSGASLTYSNAPSRSRELVDYALMPYMDAIESRLSLDDVLPRGQWCRFDTTDLLRGDFETRMAAYRTALDAGIYTKDELAAMERGQIREGNPQ